MFFVKKRLKTKNSGGDFEKNRPTSGGYYDPPFKCRVPNSFFLMLYPYLLKGFALARSEREIGEKLARNWHKQVTVIAGVFLIYGFNMDFIIKIMSIVRE
ncbi:hypothetical protein [Aerococcus urinaeequi]|uniref:hypothetical protein n=1 Tax=Aerococcus urinaeequi TaxID=51665 RepID=UPI003F4F5CC3